MQNNLIPVVTDQDIEIAFLGTDFGHDAHRSVLRASVLKKSLGYHCGYTITMIMQKMKLINEKGKLLKRGKEFLREELDFLMRRSG